MHADEPQLNLVCWRHYLSQASLPGCCQEGLRRHRAGSASTRSGASAAGCWLADKAHCFFQAGDERDLGDLCSCFKALLQAGPRHALYVITNSSMVTVWLHIAFMQPNGYSPLLECHCLNLPGSHSQEDMDLVWQALRQAQPKYNPELLKWAEPTPAMLTTLAEDWLGSGATEDLQAYAAETSPISCFSMG